MRRNMNEYEFFLSEIFRSSDECAGHVIELMRSANHIKSFQKLFVMLVPPNTEDFDEIANDLQNDPLRILVMNFAASQMRESLKLFASFSKLPCYAEVFKISFFAMTLGKEEGCRFPIHLA